MLKAPAFLQALTPALARLDGFAATAHWGFSNPAVRCSEPMTSWKLKTIADLTVERRSIKLVMFFMFFILLMLSFSYLCYFILFLFKFAFQYFLCILSVFPKANRQSLFFFFL